MKNTFVPGLCCRLRASKVELWIYCRCLSSLLSTGHIVSVNVPCLEVRPTDFMKKKKKWSSGGEQHLSAMCQSEMSDVEGWSGWLPRRRPVALKKQTMVLYFKLTGYDINELLFSHRYKLNDSCSLMPELFQCWFFLMQWLIHFVSTAFLHVILQSL